MSDLKPCPFCGGEARHYAPCPIDHHIECVECYADIHRDTEAEAIAAWNSRAERVTDDEWQSYQHSVPATEENMAKFGWVRERTCRNLDKHHNIMFKCSECGHWECQDFDGEKILPQTWNYCPNCGAKVTPKHSEILRSEVGE